MPSNTLHCPTPYTDRDTIQLAHGGGGRLTQQLLEQVFFPAFDNDWLRSRHDGAAINLSHSQIALTTDAYVVKPLFFPGGDIGKLAVCGTVNDLAMCGARPHYLTASFIIEEGFSVAALKSIVDSMQLAAQAANVAIVTGDTKVVDRGCADGLFVTTAGMGVRETAQIIAPQQVKPGDVVLLSGDVGRHGMAIMSVRSGLEFASPIVSDCASVATPVLAMLEAGIEIHCLRDLTRGGLASALVEIATTAAMKITIDEAKVPVQDTVRGACEILGLDPLYVANEGRFITILPETEVAAALKILQQFDRAASAIATVQATDQGFVTLKTAFGVERMLQLFSGEQLPRIC
jgi:hydrogenase expression/formation protein HypE